MKYLTDHFPVYVRKKQKKVLPKFSCSWRKKLSNCPQGTGVTSSKQEKEYIKSLQKEMEWE